MRGHRLTPKRRKKFLAVLAESGSVTIAAETVGIRRQAVYKARDGDPEFYAAWDKALDTYLDKLEREADRRGVEGIDHPVTFQGVITDTYKVFSDNLLMFRMKALAPQKYRENVKIEGSVTVSPDAAFLEIYERAQRKEIDVTGAAQEEIDELEERQKSVSGDDS